MKLFIYPRSKKQDHDTEEWRYNTTPLSEAGIIKHCEITDINTAEYLYTGQISCGTYNDISPSWFHLIENTPKKHIVSIEGDWLHCKIPDWALRCICAGNGNRTYYQKPDFFTRPVMSPLLIHLAKQYTSIQYNNTLPTSKSFGFRGQYDPHGTRTIMQHALNYRQLPNQIIWNQGWGMVKDIRANEQFIQDYARVVVDNIFSLCPRGCGEDTIRFYETCFFGRIPIVIGYPKFLGDDFYDMSFMYQIDPTLSVEAMSVELEKIYTTNIDQLHVKCQLAKKYFEEVVIPYFNDPTLFFLQFLKRHNI